MLLRRFQRDGRNCVLFTCLLSLFKSPVTAQQDVVLTMTSGEQCFGSRVTLLCTHPDPLADSIKYIQQTINWAEDGTVLDFTDPSSARFTPTRLNSTASTLSFTVTEEDHRDRVIACTCFLVLNNANRSREESNVVTMDALEITTPPTITSQPTNTSDVLKWTHTPNMCSDYTYRYVLTWSRTDTANNPTSGSDTVTTQEYDLSGLPPGNYTVTITAQRVDYPFVKSEQVSMLISLIATPPSRTTPTSPQDTGLSTGVVAGVVIGSVIVSVMIFIAGCGAGVIAHVYQKTSKQIASMCSCLSTKSSKSAEDKVTSSTPGYMNVELEDKSVPMTDNPSYEPVERSSYKF